MTKKQKNKIISIIKKDAKIQNMYLDCKGNTCVIGGLALAAKYSKKDLKVYGNKYILNRD